MEQKAQVLEQLQVGGLVVNAIWMDRQSNGHAFVVAVVGIVLSGSNFAKEKPGTDRSNLAWMNADSLVREGGRGGEGEHRTKKGSQPHSLGGYVPLPPFFLWQELEACSDARGGSDDGL